MNLQILKRSSLTGIDPHVQKTVDQQNPTGKMQGRKVEQVKAPINRLLNGSETVHEVRKGIDFRKVSLEPHRPLAQVGDLTALGKNSKSRLEIHGLLKKIHDSKVDSVFDVPRMTTKLVNLEAKLTQYLKGWGRNSAIKNEMRSLLSAVSAQKTYFQGIANNDTRTMVTGSKSLFYDDLASFGRHGFGLEDTAVLTRIGFRDPKLAEAFLREKKPTAEELSKILEYTTHHVKPDMALSCLRSNVSVADAIRGSFSSGERRLLESAGDDWVNVGLTYRDANVPINKDTALGVFKDANLIPPGMKEHGKGNLNTVYSGVFRENDQLTKMVFKPESAIPSLGGASLEMGINQKNPQCARRNVATYQMAKLIGFDVIPRTELGTHDGKLGVMMGFADGTAALRKVSVPMTKEQMHELQKEENGKLREEFAKKHGFPVETMKFHDMIWTVEGRKPKEFPKDDPSLRKELTKLQLLDALCGQGDRHPGNYHVEKDVNGVYHVHGIDNDQSFGKGILHPNQLLKTPKNSEYRGVKLPPIIDTDMAEAIKGLDEKSLRETLADLLEPEEIDAAVSRMNAMKSHVLELEKSGGIIEANSGDKGWGMSATDFDKHMFGSGGEANSYIARDL